MKPILQLIVLLTLTLNIKATILRCNNSPGMISVYPTLYGAVSAAQPGDTIHVEPTGIVYSPLGTNATKNNLTFIGNGIHLGQFPGEQADTNQVRIDLFYLPGENTKLFGLNLGGVHCYNNYDSSLIQYCTIGAVYLYDKASDMQIIDCTLGLKNDIGFSIKLYDSTENNIIQNCHILSAVDSDSGTISANFIHNVFETNTSSSFYFYHEFSNAIVSNCIFKDGVQTNYNSSFYDNIFCQGASSFSGNGNVSNVDPNDLFNTPSSLEDIDQQLKASYPNQNVGMFAGATPFRLAFIPPIPSIYLLTVPSVINSNIGIITVSTKSN